MADDIQDPLLAADNSQHGNAMYKTTLRTLIYIGELHFGIRNHQVKGITTSDITLKA